LSPPEKHDEEPAPRDPEDEERPPLSPGKKIAFGLVAAVIFLVFLEGIGRLGGLPSGKLRTLSKVHVGSPETFAKTLGMWQPGFKGRILWPVEVAYDVEINKLGFRGPEISREKPSGTFRVFCLGDSTTFSVYVNEAEAWPRRLEGLMRADGKTVEVVNGGHPAWSTSDELRFFRERIVDKLPMDLVLLMVCVNDIGSIPDPDGKQGMYQVALDSIHAGLSLADWMRLNTALGEFETRIEIAIKRARKRYSKEPLEQQPLPNMDWSPFEESVRRLKKECDSRKLPLLVVVFPPIDSKVVPLEPRVGKIAEKLGLPFLLVEETFAKAPERSKLFNLPFDDHANPEGNRLIAEAIHRALRTRSLGPYR